ncbi:MAG: hypothetical protein JNJ83_16015 [Verrucomicrobiaceae bacterium]|nr:hypothetical protein [Verrucomicrobiaceae bacterium]
MTRLPSAITGCVCLLSATLLPTATGEIETGFPSANPNQLTKGVVPQPDGKLSGGAQLAAS